jgi:arsenate reductase
VIKLYGIHNCDSVKKSIKTLQENNIDFEFIDFKKDGLDAGVLQNFIDKVGMEKLINKRSTTYRNLTDKEKENITTSIILNNPTLIKRPVIENGNKITVGLLVL